MIDITMTATRRAAILERTLRSFDEGLLTNYPVRLIINVDPVGPDTDRDIERVLKGCFVESNKWRYIHYNYPKTASFPKAFTWTWSIAGSFHNYVLHLEDDWVLMRHVDLQKLIEILDSDPRIASVRLPAFPAGIKTMKNWNKHFTWTGKYYAPPEGEEWLGFCGHPSLIKAEFVRKCAKLIDPELNPEKQFHRGNPELNEEFAKWKYVVYGEPGEPPTPPLIKDIGREWMVSEGYQKSGNRAFFKNWEKI